MCSWFTIRPTKVSCKNLISKECKAVRGVDRKSRVTQAKFGTLGFTVVELLIVIVVIAILATISIIAYNGVTKDAAKATLNSDIKNASTQLDIMYTKGGSYPQSEPSGSTNPPSSLKASSGNTFQYTSTGSAYCLTATSSNTNTVTLSVSSRSGTTDGACPGHTDSQGVVAIGHGSLMQTITNANCPIDRIMAVDARDNRSYWVQKMADGKCWMLTNLAYAGGGDNAHGDVKILINSSSTSGTSMTEPRYTISSGANPTNNPTKPSTSTDGSGQYGYLYNWCAAMGAQLGTGACLNGYSPTPDQNISICPAGWRLPTGGASGELQNLANSIGATNDSAGSTALRSSWLAQYGGWSRGSNDIKSQGLRGDYYSSTQMSNTNAVMMGFLSYMVDPSSQHNKNTERSVRCVAN